MPLRKWRRIYHILDNMEKILLSRRISCHSSECFVSLRSMLFTLKGMSYRFYAFVHKNFSLDSKAMMPRKSVAGKEFISISLSLRRMFCEVRKGWRREEKRLIKCFMAWEINWWEINIVHYSIFILPTENQIRVSVPASCCSYLVLKTLMRLFAGWLRWFYCRRRHRVEEKLLCRWKFISKIELNWQRFFTSNWILNKVFRERHKNFFPLNHLRGIVVRCVCRFLFCAVSCLQSCSSCFWFKYSSSHSLALDEQRMEIKRQMKV